MKNKTKIKMFKVIVIMWLLTGIWALIQDANKVSISKTEVNKQAEIVDEWQYPKVIGLIEPAKANEDLFSKYFGDKANEARQIATCESGLNEKAHNYNPKTKDDSYGLFQINLWGNNKKTRPSAETLLNPEENIKFAKSLYDNAGGFSKDWINCSRKLNIK